MPKLSTCAYLALAFLSTAAAVGCGSEDGKRGNEGGAGGAPSECCPLGAACLAGQALCTVECSGSGVACAAGQICQQGSDGKFDSCARSCDEGSLCGDVCCGAGVTCVDGACLPGDLSISAKPVSVANFTSILVDKLSCQIQEGCVTGSGERAVVEVTAAIENVGPGPFHLGAPWDNPQFHLSSCSDSYLLADFIKAEVISKTGKVLAKGYLPTSCVADAAGEYRCTLQGLAPAEVSEQPQNACNTLDVTGLAAGRYELRLTVNPDRRFAEASFENNSTTLPFDQPDCDGQMCGGVCCPSDVDCTDGVCMLPDLAVNQPAIVESLTIGHQTFGENSCELAEMCVSGSGRRRLLQFESRIENFGPGDLDPGREQGNPLFEYSQCHAHYHFLDFSDYKLLKADGSVAAQGHKQSFCLVDMEPIGTEVPAPIGTHPEPGFGGCSHLSAGWADIYGVGTPCQWIDITGVPPGDYLLQVAVNPLGKVTEKAVDNNVVQVPVTIVPDTPCQEDEICGDLIDQDCDDYPDQYDDDCGYDSDGGYGGGYADGGHH